MSGRYYKIILTPPIFPGTPAPAGGATLPAVTVAGSYSGPRLTWASHASDGTSDPNALNVLFDFIEVSASTPAGAVFFTVEGIDLKEISATRINNFKPITKNGQESHWTVQVYGGMLGGLPLAARQQKPGLILSGSVVSAFGNWVGTEMSLSCLIVPGTPYTRENPGNLVLDWQKGTELSQALASMFSTAYPTLKQKILIQNGMVNDSFQGHYAATLSQMAQHIQSVTQGWGGNESYPGVQVYIHNGTIYALDFTQALGPTLELAYDDLIGQPTWIDAATVQVRVVLRSDVQVGTILAMPAGLIDQPGLITTNPSPGTAFSQYPVNFQGRNFSVLKVRHVGNFRSQDAAQWTSVINCSTTVRPAV